MAGPAAAAGAKAAAQSGATRVAHPAPAAPARPPPVLAPGRGGGRSVRGDDGGGGWPLRIGLALLAGVLGLVLLVLSPLLVFVSSAEDFCGAGGAPADDLDVPGSLGGVAGTGVTRAELRLVRKSPLATASLREGSYLSTAYGPPWGGINGSGIATAGGLVLNGGAPRKYFVATDPGELGLGRLIYIWPNPFAWKGPFVTADTGGAIRGRRIDFYDWRGRTSQLAWGSTNYVEVARRPIIATGGGGAPTPAALGQAAPDAGCGQLAGGGLSLPGPIGEVVIAPGANYPGEPLQPVLVAYLEKMAGVTGRRIVVTTGTAHSTYTTSGTVSEHSLGLAADMGSALNGFPIASPGSPVGYGDRIAAAALVMAGIEPDRALALARGGGLWNLCRAGMRVQVIWRTGEGGDHWNHVHVGLKPGGCSGDGLI